MWRWVGGGPGWCDSSTAACVSTRRAGWPGSPSRLPQIPPRCRLITRLREWCGALVVHEGPTPATPCREQRLASALPPDEVALLAGGGGHQPEPGRLLAGHADVQVAVAVRRLVVQHAETERGKQVLPQDEL